MLTGNAKLMSLTAGWMSPADAKPRDIGMVHKTNKDFFYKSQTFTLRACVYKSIQVCKIVVGQSGNQ